MASGGSCRSSEKSMNRGMCPLPFMRPCRNYVLAAATLSTIPQPPVLVSQNVDLVHQVAWLDEGPWPCWHRELSSDYSGPPAAGAARWRHGNTEDDCGRARQESPGDRAAWPRHHHRRAAGRHHIPERQRPGPASVRLHRGGTDPYQIEVGNPTPQAALPFLFPGSRVPVKIGT